ncbi:MAG: hypothetical protein P1U32_01700 [Legionellaceae bacterium]|nr:hypothetical protein [Legionellaceae bacterium]
MKGFLFSILAIFFPWTIFLLEEKIGLAFLAMALQVTIIGWLPMTFLAFNHRSNLSFFEKKAKANKKAG